MAKNTEPEVDDEGKETLAAIGERLKELRKAAGLSQTQLAEQVGLHQSYIHLVEAGAQNITVTVLTRFASKFNKPVASFFPEAQLEEASEESLTHLASVVEKLTEAVRARRKRDMQLLEESESLLTSVRRRLDKGLLKGKGARRKEEDD
jgi:transcriptional regulator with XRE-family HTH domain